MPRDMAVVGAKAISLDVVRYRWMSRMIASVGEIRGVP
jgi:hypothetical protein